MRFHFDENDQGGRAGPFEPNPEPRSLDHKQRVEFLRLLHDGLGRTMSCAQLGITIVDLKRTMAKSSSFRKAVKHVEQVRVDNLFTGLYVAALRGDTKAAMFLLSRRDREVDARNNMAD